MYQYWMESVEKKNSLICAGIDPPIFEMGRGNKGLLKGENKEEWSIRYIEAVAPHVAALKFNSKYWSNDESMLQRIIKLAHDLKIPIIQDSKFSDIGSTNDAGFFQAKMRGVDATTIAPYAGNLQESLEQAKNRELSVFSMCLMSNPEFQAEKNAFIPLTKEEFKQGKYHLEDIESFNGQQYIKKYIKSAHDTEKHGGQGVVIGATAHITKKEIATAVSYLNKNMLILLPGIGEQGGDFRCIAEETKSENIIVNIGRSLMFPKSGVSPRDQKEAARTFQQKINELRK